MIGDFQCMVANVYYEAGNQPFHGMVAVSHVVLNRAKDKHRRPCEVIFEPYQFSWTAGKHVYQYDQKNNTLVKSIRKDKLKYNQYRWAELAAFVSLVIPDITGGARYFRRHDVKFDREHGMKKTVRVDDHVFFKKVRKMRKHGK